jgi:dipeptidyl-peptidase-4
MYRSIPFLALLLCSLWTLSATAQQKKAITLEDIFSKGTFRQEMVAGFRSMQDGAHFTEISSSGHLIRVRFSDGATADTILNLKDLQYEGKKLEVQEYRFNRDESKLMLLCESENIYRRSVLYRTYVYDLGQKELIRVHADKILHPDFSPGSDKVAYVYHNDLYYLDLTSGETVTVSYDGEYLSEGQAGNLINGNCDWVYEEEFEFTKAYEWSESGDYLAYYHFDQTEVPEFNFAVYDKLYPTQYRYKYPKAGEKNSVVSIRIFRLNNGRTIECDLGSETDQYIPRIRINPFDNTLMIWRLNRLQNHLQVLRADDRTGNTEVVYEEKNPWYIEINDHVRFLKKSNAMVYTSEKDGYTHLYLHDLNTMQSTAITKGEWEVSDLAGVDEEKSILYFMSTEKSPLERQLHSIGLNGENKRCLTPDAGTHSISFGENFRYYLDRHSDITMPPVYALVETESGKRRVLKENAPLKKKMAEYDLSALELMQVPNAEGTMLNAWILKPQDFNANKKYPLLMFQYSGPGSQQVTNQFSGRDFWWYQMLASKGYVIVCVDGTGTGFRGQEFKKKTYLQLGKYESDDQIAAARWFAGKPWIDASRIGIWGWSYGGYMSSICLLKGADVFKMAIAVAPVTNWRYYDNIYTERYMRTPQENPTGYDDNSPVNMVEKLKGKYLLVHGTADDNVHYQNALEMQKALIDKNKDFDSEAYPNKNHGISGGTTRLHLYRRLTQFILDNL